MGFGLFALFMALGLMSFFVETDSSDEPETVGGGDGDDPILDPDLPGDGPAPAPPTPAPPAPGPLPTDPAPTDPVPTDPTPTDPPVEDPTPVDPTPDDPTPEVPLPGGVTLFTDDDGNRTFIFTDAYRGGGTITGGPYGDIIDMSMSPLAFENFVTLNADGSGLIGTDDGSFPPTTFTSVSEFILPDGQTVFDARAFDGPVTATATSGVNFMFGGSGETTLTGTGGFNIMQGGDGPTQFYSLGGNSEMIGGTGASQFVATSGDNTMIGGQGENSFFAGPGQDSIVLGPSTNNVYGALGLESFGAVGLEPSYLGQTVIDFFGSGFGGENYINIGLGDSAFTTGADSTIYRVTAIGPDDARPAEILGFRPTSDSLFYQTVVGEGDGPAEDRPITLTDTERGVVFTQDGRETLLVYDITVAELLVMPADAFRTDEVLVLGAAA